MKLRSRPQTLAGWLILFCCLIACAAFAAEQANLKFKALLIWATNSETSPDRSHKPVDSEVRKKLSDLPLKWKNYFVVTNVTVLVPAKGSERAKLSEKCEVEIKDIDGKHEEISLIGKGEPVLKRVQPLLKDKMLVLGGNAPEETGWLVVIKRVE